jgi:hypothetical protein
MTVLIVLFREMTVLTVLSFRKTAGHIVVTDFPTLGPEDYENVQHTALIN